MTCIVLSDHMLVSKMYWQKAKMA